MIHAVIPISVSLAWWCLSVHFARREYRQVYQKLRSERVPALYGRGWMDPDDKHRKALWAAYNMLAFWLLILGRRAADRMVSAPGRGWADLHALDVLEAETERLRPAEPVVPLLLQGVSAEGFLRDLNGPCPCGYRDECPVHCGDGHVTGACAKIHREFM